MIETGCSFVTREPKLRRRLSPRVEARSGASQIGIDVVTNAAKSGDGQLRAGHFAVFRADEAAQVGHQTVAGIEQGAFR